VLLCLLTVPFYLYPDPCIVLYIICCCGEDFNTIFELS